MTDQPEERAIDRLRALARNHPLPPIGSFEADLVRPPIGRVKLGDVGEGLWIWPDSGDPEGLTWDRVGFIGQRGSLIKLDWAGRELLLEFGSNTAALDAAAMISAQARTVTPPAPSPPPGRPEPATPQQAGSTPRPEPGEPAVDVEPATSTLPKPAVVEPATVVHGPPEAVEKSVIHDHVRPKVRKRSSGRRSPLRRIGTTILALVFIAAAAVGGIVIGQRLIGDGPAASDGGPRPVVIREATGEGEQVLGSFVADGPWKVLWENTVDEPLTITAIDDAGTAHVLVETDSVGQDAVFGELAGRVTVTVEGRGPWRVAVVERDPTALDG